MTITDPILFCPDCGTNCEHMGTNDFLNQWCFTCPNCSSHWLRYYRHVEYLRVDECEISHNDVSGVKLSTKEKGS